MVTFGSNKYGQMGGAKIKDAPPNKEIDEEEEVKGDDLLPAHL